MARRLETRLQVPQQCCVGVSRVSILRSAVVNPHILCHFIWLITVCTAQICFSECLIKNSFLKSCCDDLYFYLFIFVESDVHVCTVLSKEMKHAVLLLCLIEKNLPVHR